MTQVECVLFDCDGTLVDSEVLCCEAYVNLFAMYGVTYSLEYCLKEFKGKLLYITFERVSKEHGLTESFEELERLYRLEIARLFDLRLRDPIEGVKPLLESITVPMAVVSNGPVSKMQHSLGLTEILPFFGEHLYSGFDIQRWKPDPALLVHAAEKLNIPLEHCILVEDSESGSKAGIAAGIPVFYYCADPHNPPIHHPLVTTFHHMSELPALWQARGWNITR